MSDKLDGDTTQSDPNPEEILETTTADDYAKAAAKELVLLPVVVALFAALLAPLVAAGLWAIGIVSLADVVVTFIVWMTLAVLVGLLR